MIKLIVQLQVICLAFALTQPSFWSEYGKQFKLNEQNLFLSTQEYVVQHFDQIVDHTAFTEPQTFQQKYLVRSQYWNPLKGPIFFYCGNEGPIEMFYQNSGFLNDDLAKEFQALVIYVEHRYFGESQPFGDQKTSYEKKNIRFLTAEQALQDYAHFIKLYKQANCPDCEVYAFGGSYGGMLAAWLRMKYPNVVNGALAASAPIYYFRNREGLDINIFYKISTKDFTTSSIGDLCPQLIREAYKRLEAWDTKDYQALNTGFKLCTPITNSTGLAGLENYLNQALTYMAMTNYPYETKFLKKLPGWPARTACEQLKGATLQLENEELFDYIRKAIEIYYNYEQKESCNEVQGTDQSSDEDMSGWNILACADMVMPMGSDGIEDMFNSQPWSYENYTLNCQKTYGLTPDYDYTLEHFGGIRDKDMVGYSNIFFSNGKLDPWSGGSPVTQISESLPVIYMEDCAHHLDLRAPNSEDPESVREGRRQETAFLSRLIRKQITE